jgi:hypothetical protein
VDLTEKEGELRVLQQAIVDLKTDVLLAADDRATVQADASYVVQMIL